MPKDIFEVFDFVELEAVSLSFQNRPKSSPVQHPPHIHASVVELLQIYAALRLTIMLFISQTWQAISFHAMHIKSNSFTNVPITPCAGFQPIAGRGSPHASYGKSPIKRGLSQIALCCMAFRRPIAARLGVSKRRRSWESDQIVAPDYLHDIQ